ncbi:hypothetical protein OU426_01190 [Frigidibacter sp. RF13]|uniref:hypothetical protein n=1 Tax=Frigidibacter sp. RF13 TaxID=2997340 RepID=UPI002270E16F|nr:hypothetical protein [Frigidibacter sp. RF13]MCY1125455.1 hypothetical protein [Frigidibacter sp. RF13]
MHHPVNAELIERALDRAAAAPDRVPALKRLLRRRLEAPPSSVRGPTTASDPLDDNLWDNVPV